MNGGPYDLRQTPNGPDNNPASPSVTSSSMEYSEIDQDSYVAASSVTAGMTCYHDATESVHEMHLALLYLLSNPEEFKKVASNPPAALSDWNNEYSDETTTADGSVSQQSPLPYVVFADDAEVVLPQAHTASQLFGIERVEGIELEAAAGVPALSQLFQRWLALMPGGDHLHIIDPPGLTVMRIAGGRYRVTAAHRVVWTWMNEFAPLGDSSQQQREEPLTPGDLVTMTIVDVFETDNNGKLLSYCPTFDNRAIHKTNQASETLRRGSSILMHSLSNAAKSQTAVKMNQAAAHVTRVSISAAKHVADNVREKMHDSFRGTPAAATTVDAQGFEQALEAAEQAANNNTQGSYLSEEGSTGESQ